MKKIKLTKSKFALVDDEDFDYLNQWKWHYTGTGYAGRKIYPNGRYDQKMLYLHRVIMQTPVGLDVDHIDHDRLNNQKSNLRNCTRTDNLKNRKMKVKRKRLFGGE